MSKYHSDKPIDDKALDEFNRKNFVIEVVEALERLEEDENYIIGLFAKWGYGKTSTVNLLGSELASRDNVFSVYSSAWQLGGDYEKIVWDILNQVSTELTGKNAISKRKAAGRFINKFGNAELPFELGKDFDLNQGGRNETKVTSGKILNSARFIGQMLESSDSIERARKRIEAAIKGSKIIVFIDDLDRLNGKQIIDILRAISSVANYGGITYILPFDKFYVCSAIEEFLPKNQSGADFLEKLIQIPITLPVIPQNIIDELFANQFGQLLEEFGGVLKREEITRFQMLFYNGEVNKYINSPRDINKIINALRFKLPSSIGEINIVDTITLEVLRVFDEEFYELIHQNKSLLISFQNSFGKYFMDGKGEKRKEDITKIFGSEERKIGILRNLFPLIDNLYTNVTSTDEASLRKLQRVASEYYFDVFFSSFDEKKGISDKKLVELYIADIDAVEMYEQLCEIVTPQNIEIAIQKIKENSEKIKSRLELSKALLDLIELLPDKYATISFLFSTFDKTIYTVEEVLKLSNSKLDDFISILDYNFEKKRFDTLPNIINDVILHSKEKEYGKTPLLKENELQIYKNHALEIIRRISELENLTENPSYRTTLIYYLWVSLGQEDEVINYNNGKINSSENAIDFISKFLGTSSPLGTNDYHRHDFEFKNLETLKKYVSVEKLYELIVNDFKQYKEISEEEVIYFGRDHYSRNYNLSSAGNEKLESFRKIVACQFIYPL